MTHHTTAQPSRAIWCLLGALCALGGCESDGFIDPSVVGRWEHTPTIVPILERIDAIESDTGQFVDITPILPEDLQPVSGSYSIVPGDVLEITIFDFIQPGVPSSFQRSVSANGTVLLPQLPPVQIAGLDAVGAEQALSDAVARAGIMPNAEVSVNALSRRDQTFGIFGAVPNVGRYAIPSPDYRILDALTDAGGVSPVIEEVFVIREVALSDGTSPVGRDEPVRPAPAQPRPDEDSEEVDLQDLIDRLAEPEDSNEAPGAMPGMLQGALDDDPQPRRRPTAVLAQRDDSGDSSQGPAPLIDLTDEVSGQDTADSAGSRVDLPEPGAPRVTAPQDELFRIQSEGRWMYMDGRWVKVLPAAPGSGLPEASDPLDEAPEVADFATQRIIRVPTAPLFQGVSQFNIVVRPGDVINVPIPQSGVVYVSGPGIVRPGVYNLPATGKLTLKRLVAAAGGLSAIAIPERVDITRMIGTNREGTVRINLRAVYEGTHPDVFVKTDDLVNFGTNFWATPLAVIRGGFRVSYGFGFLLDRNFGNDVFGPPPTNNNNGQNN